MDVRRKFLSRLPRPIKGYSNLFKGFPEKKDCLFFVCPENVRLQSPGNLRLLTPPPLRRDRPERGLPHSSSSLCSLWLCGYYKPKPNGWTGKLNQKNEIHR
jgi:hypothetical protein